MLKNLVFLTVLLNVIGCTSEATQLIVVVDSDLRPQQMNTVEVFLLDQRMDGPNRSLSRQRFDTTSLGIPFSFGVEPEDDPNEDVFLLVQGFERQPMMGPPMLEVLAATGFVENETRRLYLFMAQSCIPLDCRRPMTCRDGACGSDAYPPNTLPQVEPEEELFNLPPRPDAGPLTSDSGVTENDSGVEPDSGAGPVDTGIPDTGVSSDSGVDADTGVDADAGVAPSDAGTPDSGDDRPNACEVQEDCDEPMRCPPDATMGCACRNTPMGRSCVPRCQMDSDCPMMGMGGGMLRCDTAMNICVP